MMAMLLEIRIEIEIPVAIMLYNDVTSMQQRSFPKLDAYSEHCGIHLLLHGRRTKYPNGEHTAVA
jgi:hypothetical protein